MAALEAALGPAAADLTPVMIACTDAEAMGTHVGASATTVYGLTTTTVPTGTEIALSSWALTGGAPPVSVVRVTATHDSATSFFLGGYVGVSPSQRRVAFGYTLGDATFSGRLYTIVAADGSETSVAADGNFDAAWLDDTTLLLNGAGLEAASGQALYFIDFSSSPPATGVAADGLGMASGSVAVTPEYVLVGGLFDGFTSATFTLPRAAVEDVVAGRAGPIHVADAAGVASEGVEVCPGCGMPSAFDLVGDLLVTTRWGASGQEALEARRVTGYSDTSGLSLGDVSDLTTGATFTAAYPASGGRILLRFAEGVLLVE